LRLDETKDGLHGDRRVDGRAPLVQNLHPRRHGQRIGGCDHGVPRRRRLLNSGRRLRAGGGRKAKNDGEDEGCG
jgi:hypothetical protein